MDRRFFTWLMLTTALLFFYLSLRQPPPQPAAVVPPAAEAEADAADDELVPSLDAAGDGLAKPQNPAAAITLGSMDPAQGYNLAVTLTSRGGGLEHAELVGQTRPGKFRYRALEHDGGYLGYLGLVETATGLRVRTLPDGSPASLAQGAGGQVGLQVGDIITELDGVSLSSRAALEKALEHTKPGQTAKLMVERDVQGAVQQLVFNVKLSETPLDALRMYPGSSEDVAGNLQRPNLLTTLGSFEGKQIPTGGYTLPALRESFDLDWEMRPLKVQGGQGVEFRLPLESFMQVEGQPQKLDIVKRYRLLPASETHDGYLLDLETVIVNRRDAEVQLSFRQEGLSGLTLEGWWYSVKISPHMFAGAGQRDVIYETDAAGHRIATTRAIADHARTTAEATRRGGRGGLTPTPDGLPTVLLSENEPAEARKLDYIGLDAPYFSAALLPHPDDPDSLTDLRRAGAFAVALPEQIKKAQLQATNTSFWLDTQELTVPAGGEVTQRYQVFIGPKAPELLASHGLERAIEYGWFPWIAKPLSAILHFFHFIVGNYGLAIVLLTVMVRALMFPLGRKAAMNAQRMQELQPELKRINDLYKDNMEKRAKAMQELYAKHNFKPLAGCLPMFIQLPIFIGLYRCLSVDISLRQAPLIPGLSWASNLAGPDQLLNWSSWMPDFIAGRGTGWLGPYFNILPMVTVVLFLLQQKMLMPKATDDQTRMTQNMMQVMTIFMGVLFFKVPSGLCIYFITSSAWSLVERKLVKRMTPPSSSTGGEPTDSSPPKKPSNEPPQRTNPKNRRKGQEVAQAKSPGRLQEIMQMLEKPAVKSATQRGSRKDKKRRRP
ncbi:MAG: YidC/Oxa1 family insertase periplasmic-domain containing protein [Planctomycetales bacterium]|nr:YidC/Oxa1 family insertase periplasmic-domain containing protein [Planctomycetales bacterium]